VRGGKERSPRDDCMQGRGKMWALSAFLRTLAGAICKKRWSKFFCWKRIRRFSDKGLTACHNLRTHSHTPKSLFSQRQLRPYPFLLLSSIILFLIPIQSRHGSGASCNSNKFRPLSPATICQASTNSSAHALPEYMPHLDTNICHGHHPDPENHSHSH